ncbi:restriction endonuclease [Planctomycetes bacterium Pla163]|uniref:McrB family protein n=1 Tax=Rohdeia mirabilis TaxID=2528008 RepID=UPI0011A9F05E
MPDFDLTTDDGLAQACNEILAQPGAFAEELTWFPALVELIEFAAQADEAERASIDLHQRIWRSNPIPVSWHAPEIDEEAIANEEFRRWFAKWSLTTSPGPIKARRRFFEDYLDASTELLASLLDARPYAWLRRGASIFHPEALTSELHPTGLGQLQELLGLQSIQKPLVRSIAVAKRFETVLGPCGSSAEDRAMRLALSSMLLRLHDGGVDSLSRGVETGTSRRLHPLPPERRRKGIVAIKGKLETLIATTDFVSHGVTRDELLDFLRERAPTHKDSTLGTWINSMRADFGVIDRTGDLYTLTERGESLLDSCDPIELADLLLTHSLGFDEALRRLRDHGPEKSKSLSAGIQRLNPGWTTDREPATILLWLRSFGVLEATGSGETRLTERGEEWAKLITWQPEPFVPKDVDEEEIEDEPTVAADTTLVIPKLTSITTRLAAHGTFPPPLVAQLHAGLWANARRHFAVLSGLSGSGKTLLACGYARSLFEDGDPRANTHLRVVAVQPGWYDPTALLGYVNPLRGDAYVRTEFLEFLMRVVEHPSEPFVCVLDEMNLSHPEQYMAPLLSAMETGNWIHLHSEGEVFDGVPPRIPYPKNLVLIGTVNMDETTHGLSDKVLDRAFTLEFWDIDLDAYPRWNGRELTSDSAKSARALLGDLMQALAPARMHFGWRVVDEVLDFLVRNQVDGGQLGLQDALDAVVYAKVLPKLRGEDAPRFREALVQAGKVLAEHGLTRSRAKLAELSEDLDHRGSARFWR